jgi:quercetin dioxygenase-like cupin family protein
MNTASQTSDGFAAAAVVKAGEDRFGEHRSLGISTIYFKVVTPDLLVLDTTYTGKGGPPRHLHVDQDEWFFVIEGLFLLEVGEIKFTLGPGDSLFAPRKVPHAYASVGDGGGRLLITFNPAGKMEAFFREVTKANAMPPQTPSLWHDHGMELVGPPLVIA